MDIGWYLVHIPCPMCKGEFTDIMSASYAADGELKFSRYCATCKETISWRVFASQLAHRALCNDLEKDGKPPLKTLEMPRQPEKLTENDRKLERSMGIEPEGEVEE